MNYPSSMDAECIPICNALNALPGIRTVESCCGHGEHPHRVFFTAQAVESLRPILCCSHSSGWHVEANWANGSNTIYFMLEGPIGPADKPGGANDFASWLADELQKPTA